MADVISFPDGSSPVTVARLRSKRAKASIARRLVHYDGQDFPNAYFSDSLEESWDANYRVVPGTDGDQFTNLVALLAAPSVLKYVHDHGATISVAVLDASVDFFMFVPTKPQDVTLTLTRVQPTT